MEENKEKKEVKITLGTFTVLIVSVLILVITIILALYLNNIILNTKQPVIQNQQIQNTQVLDK